MGFCERLNSVFLVLGCSNARIAAVCGIDASVVSRFRSGIRVPRRTSTQYKKLCQGIVDYVSQQQKWDELCKTCGLSCNDDPYREISEFLLVAGYDKSKASRNDTLAQMLDHRQKSKQTVSFGEKLSTLMNMFQITNIRLAKHLSVDSSLISRYRNGLRTPHADSGLVLNLCGYIHNRAINSGRETELAELTGLSESEINADSQAFIRHVAAWLSDKHETDGASMADSFLDKLDTLSPSGMQLPPVNSIAPAGILAENISRYEGIDGLRRAVIRFLGSVALLDGRPGLKLYSDQNMEWMSGDPAFLQKWMMLMCTVLKNKNTIKIIHNIDRSLPEMLVAVEKWLPLYMTGLIEAYYCKKPGDGRFANTFFIAPDYAAVSSNLVIGTEDSGRYHYSTVRDDVSYAESQFDALLDISKTLVQVYNASSRAKYDFKISEMSKQEGITKKLLLSLPIASMPKALLKRILERNSVDSGEITQILEHHDIRVRQFERELHSGGVVECAAMPDDERLFSGMVRLDMSELFSGRPLTYTTEEFSAHVSAVASMLDNPNYSFVPLPESPFAQIQMILKRGVGAMAVKSYAPTAAFWFGHPLMVKAFEDYLDTISNTSVFKNKDEVKGLLGRYLSGAYH